MSRDIRSYFLTSGGSKKKEDNAKKEDKNVISRQRKRQIIVLDSDSDEDPLPSQVKKHKSSNDTTSLNKQAKKSNKNAPPKPELKPVNIADVFGDSHIKRSAAKTKAEPKKIKTGTKPPLEDEHSDPDFEETLRQLDEKDILGGKDKKKSPDKKDTLVGKDMKRSPDEKDRKRSPVKDKRKESQDTSVRVKVKEESDIEHASDKRKHRHDFTALESNKISASPKKKEKLDIKSEKLVNGKEENKGKQNKNHSASHLDSDKKNVSPENKIKKEKKDENKGSVKCDTPTDKNRSANDSFSGKKSTDDSFSDDAFDKKRQHAIQYQKYLHREGPKNPGGKEIPEGKPGCLSGLVFVVTGVLDTIDRDQAASLIQQYGGKVTSNVSRNTSYLVVGDEPGPSKVEKATKLGTKQLTEDGLLDLIRTSTGPSEKTDKTPNKKDSKKQKNADKISSSPVIQITKENKISEKTKVDIGSKTSTPTTSTTSETSTNLAGPVEDNLKNASLWVDKYKPKTLKQIIGQQGDRSNVKKLLKWLENWHSNHSGKKKLVRPSPWAKDDSGAFFKAALLSGPPGVGKTTTAHLVCKELGFDVVEFNASDTRSKRLLHEEVSELLNSKSLAGYFQDAAGNKPTVKHVLVMDEVDGMAGNEDRGGIQELIQLIKNARIPVICMCNDRHHQKIRSLTNYCFDLQFSRPRVEQIRGAMMSICFKEGIKIPPEALNDIITASNHDIRQVLHHLSLWSVNEKQLTVEQVKEESQKSKKNIKLGPWDVLKKVFSADAHKTMSIQDKSDLFFYDYSLGPLFVHENYLNVQPHKAKGNVQRHLELIAKTAESISMGDIVETTIRSRSAWNLLPTQAMYSSVIPGDLMEGHLTSQINFPSWLGRNSTKNKLNRLLQELHMHMRLSISGSKEAVNLDYLQTIRDAITRPLIEEGADGIPATMSMMQNYYLLREDIDSILELSVWPNQKDPMSLVDSKVKAALTRTYNKEGIKTPYSIINIKKTAGKASLDTDVGLEVDEDNAENADEEEEDITKDAMIKAKKRPASSKDSNAGPSAAKKPRGGGKGNTKEAKGKKKK